MSRRLIIALALVACGLGLTGCGGAQGVSGTRGALGRAGFRGVAVTARTGGGVDVVTVHAAAGPGAGPDRAAEVVWRALPVRFDRLVVWLGPGPPSSYGYDDLATRFGARDRALDRGQIGDETGPTASRLRATLALGALLAGAGAVAGGLLVRRGLRAGAPGPPGGGLGHAEGPSSEVGEASPTAEASADPDGAEAMPS